MKPLDQSKKFTGNINFKPVQTQAFGAISEKKVEREFAKAACKKSFKENYSTQSKGIIHYEN